MAVLVRILATGMDQATYDQMSPGLHELVKKQPGFIIHGAYSTTGGFGIGEVWESQAHQEAWFNEHAKPNLPAPDAMSTEYVQLRAVV